MSNWADMEAELIVDTFVADQASDDLLRLQLRSADALLRAFEKGRKEKGPD